MPLSIHFQPFFFLETITIVLMSLFGGLLFVALIVILILFNQKRQQRKLGEAIETEIDINAKYHQIRKEAQKAKQLNDYRKSVIYNAFAFRILCQEVLTVRNGRTIPFDELISILKGTPKLDNKKIKMLIEIYDEARFSASDITYDDSRKVEEVLESLIQSLEIKDYDL